MSTETMSWSGVHVVVEASTELDRAAFDVDRSGDGLRALYEVVSSRRGRKHVTKNECMSQIKHALV